jgi:MFS family permease
VNDFNPYAAPEAPVSSIPMPGNFGEVRGVWQDGDTLVMAKIAELPNRCVKCNAPATFLVKRSLSWHHPALYLMVFFPGLLFYVIVALIVRKTAKIFVPLCEEHRDRRSKRIMIAWFVALAGIALCFAPAFNENLVLLIFVGIAMILFGMIFGSNVSQIVTPKKIDVTHVWLKNVSPVYLSTLPALVTYEEAISKSKPMTFEDGF